MARTRTSHALAGVATLFALGCAGGADEASPAAETAPAAAPAPATTERAVTIESPADGAEIAGPDVEVVLSVSGFEVAPVAEGRMETGHHHLYLDVDVTPLAEMIPLDNPAIIHMGDGRATHTFEGLAPGEHRVIAVVADPTHTPFDPPVVDTVTFNVSGG
ncbi:MAG: DUF4399 domain-containing protein [Gemmatimonadota bacterium]|nr:DUF4399 domain-containing protein [Gemmatimonadota bacterium]